MPTDHSKCPQVPVGDGTFRPCQNWYDHDAELREELSKVDKIVAMATWLREGKQS